MTRRARPLLFAPLAAALSLSCGASTPTTASSASSAANTTAASEAPLEVRVSGTVKGSYAGAVGGAKVLKAGDEIVLGVRASRDAFVSVAYCDGRGGLSLFPDKGALVAHAGTDLRVPTGDASFTLDETVGPEAIYVVVSTKPLDRADPALASALSRAAAGGSCPTPSLESGVGEAAPTTAPSASSVVEAAPTASTSTGAAGSKPNRGVVSPPAPPPPSLVAAAPKPARPSVAVRGVVIKGNTGETDLRARADESGIAILRIAFDHVR